MNQIDFDPVVPSEWLPWLSNEEFHWHDYYREVRLSEYNQMITSYLRNSQSKFIDKCIKEYEDAKSVRIKKSSD